MLVWRLFYQLAVRRHIFGEQPDGAVVQQALEVEIPDVLDYLETRMPEQGFMFGALSIADISIACFARTASFVRYTIDAGRWPRSAGLVARVQALPVFLKLAAFEDCMLLLPLAEQRAALASVGAPLCGESLGMDHPATACHALPEQDASTLLSGQLHQPVDEHAQSRRHLPCCGYSTVIGKAGGGCAGIAHRVHSHGFGTARLEALNWLA